MAVLTKAINRLRHSPANCATLTGGESGVQMFMLTGVLGAMMVGVALVGLVSGLDLSDEKSLPETEPDGSGGGTPPQESVAQFPPSVASGTEGDEILTGGAGENQFNGFGGNDSVVGGGDTAIDAGSGDVVSLDDGAGSALTGDWIIDPVELTDFDVNEDTLLLIYDDTAEDEPVLELVPSPTDPESIVLTMNGDAVATLNHIDETSTNSIVLLPQSSLAGGNAS